ncbi:DNA mismatch repair protein MutS [Halalkalibacillus halophilus]|uniref:DNA mismatch repair protein MutS n=1 Tax=Halalkalibacillus halophilus TaxID=392827 RepID=UPI000426736B|nr:DNA mismatch repair protein MutS [Halalkalibacillus halophilus]
MSNYTPMIKQYINIKNENQDAFLFFRLGDFYELFFDDALKAAKELEITLTQRDAGKEKIPMCGVPHHSAEVYIRNLITKGYKVAICEQVEDPKDAKGVVKREVVQVISPGTVMEGNMLEEKENNYLASIYSKNDIHIVSYTDLSTGESSVSRIIGDFKQVLSEIVNRPVKEIVVTSDFPESNRELLELHMRVTVSYCEETEIPDEVAYLVASLDEEDLIKGFGLLFQYISQTQKRYIAHLQPVQYVEIENYMKLDFYSKRNLEIMESIRDQSKQGTLLHVLDQTVTAMGGRKLKKWLDRPLLNKKHIEVRHQQVSTFISSFMERESLRTSLQNVYDLERLAGRISYGNVNARDLLQLKRSLGALPEIQSLLKQINTEEVSKLIEEVNDYKPIFTLLEKSIHEDAAVSITEGDIIKDGYNEQLDAYREASRNGKAWIANLEREEREHTGIRSLKVGFNKVFGYYIEITKANIPHVDQERYERKQTLSNAERYITPELKEKESLILEAKEKSVALEYDLFVEIRSQLKEAIPKLQRLASQVSELDVLLGFAQVSEQNNYIHPTYTKDHVLNLEQARHPVVEQVMQEEFVPNTIKMDEGTQIQLITGPNMAGKSTYMRQLGLIAVMAQVGCFIPADVATLPIFDQIFTRIGAADDLVSGQSTFMVEMLEAENAVTHATENSLVLFDEIGRGTSTYDGMALAQSIVEYLHDEVKAKTLFATHYHELTSLEDTLETLQNVHVEVDEKDGEVVFLHHIKPGKANKSYGIHVAKLANLPDEIIHRANYLLETFESSTEYKDELAKEQQLTLFEESESLPSNREQELINYVKDLNIMNMTPMDAMNALFELQKKVEK